MSLDKEKIEKLMKEYKHRTKIPVKYQNLECGDRLEANGKICRKIYIRHFYLDEYESIEDLRETMFTDVEYETNRRVQKKLSKYN